MKITKDCDFWSKIRILGVFVIVFTTFKEIGGVAVPTISRGREQKSQEDVEGIMDRLLANYSKHMRPEFEGDPINVTITTYILDLYNIDEQNHEFTANLYFRQSWRDSRLLFDENIGIKRFQLNSNSDHINKIWTPDTFIVNERKSRVHDLTMKNVFLRLDHTGEILSSMRFTVTASCKMSLGWFPFDRHTCTLEIESYAYSASDIVLLWKKDELGSTQKAFGVSKEISSLKFDIKAIKNREVSEVVSNTTYRRLAMEFFLVRSSTKYIQDFYFPAIALTIIAFVTLHAGGSQETRLKICVFCMGLLLLLVNLSASSMPNTSYQTALDFYIFNCIALTLNAVLVHFGLSHFEKPQRNQVISMRYVQQGSSDVNCDGKETLCDVDGERELTSDFLPMGHHNHNYSSKFKLTLYKSCKQSKMILPIVFVIFNIIYWIVVLIGSSGYPEDFLILEKRE